MRKLLLVLLVFLSLNATAQKLIGGDHILKTNLSSDALKNYNLILQLLQLPLMRIQLILTQWLCQEQI